MLLFYTVIYSVIQSVIKYESAANMVSQWVLEKKKIINAGDIIPDAIKGHKYS